MLHVVYWLDIDIEHATDATHVFMIRTLWLSESVCGSHLGGNNVVASLANCEMLIEARY